MCACSEFTVSKPVLVSVAAAFFGLSLLVGCASVPGDKLSRFLGMSAEEVLSQMTTEEKVAQLFVISLDSLDFSEKPEYDSPDSEEIHTELSAEMKETAKKYPVGGYIIFAHNIKGKKQLKKLTKDLSESTEVRPIIAVDEEGGRVARLAKTKSLKIKNVGEMIQIGETGNAENAKKAGKYIGSYLREYGFTVDFAPVADVNTNSDNIIIGNRSFGSDPELVARMDRAFLEGLHSKGIKGCLKHFPGHGDTKADTHADYVSIEKTWEELKDCELVPFIKNIDCADMIMLAHISMKTMTNDDIPASLSKEIITEKLRTELGFNGIILTDALNMGAIEKHYSSSKAALMAFEAGNDIILMPSDFRTAYEGVLQAVKTGRISEARLNESVLRILRFKGL